MNVILLSSVFDWSYYTIPAIALFIGTVYGLIAARKGRFDVLAILIVPTLVVGAMFAFVFVAILTTPSGNPSPAIIRAILGGLLLLPTICLIAVPPSLAGCVVSQLLYIGTSRLRQRASEG